MYLVICDKDQYNEFSYGPNDKIWSMIDKKEDWNKIAEYIQVKKHISHNFFGCIFI